VSASSTWEPVFEKEVTLPKVSVVLTTVQHGASIEFECPRSNYNICQRLSDNHPPLRIGNLAVREAFPRVRSVAFLPPGCLVRVYPMEQSYRVLNFSFDKTYFEQVTDFAMDLWKKNARALVSIRNMRLEMMMQEVYAELVRPGFGHELLIEAAGTMILVEFARYGQHLERSDNGNSSGQGLAPWQLRRIHERIEASLEIGYPRLGELADVCGISQSHLMRSFKISTGWQLHKFIAAERLNAAKRMLASGNFDSKEISTRLGMGNPAYFATSFRRMTGMTPTEYRKQAGRLGSGFIDRDQ
jgi:AraC-like DNA-binding protein